jgi:hypothetical protein
MKRPSASLIIVTLALFVSLIGTGSAASSSLPKGGPIELILQPSQEGPGKIIVTGAIGDYGRSSPTEPKGSKRYYGVETLTKGTFQIDLTAITRKFFATTPAVDPATCSAEVSETAPAAISHGTGSYKGVHGSVTLTDTFAFISPRYTDGEKKGQCNGSATVANLSLVYGTGHVSL